MTYTIVVVGGIIRRILAKVEEMPEPGTTTTTKAYDSHTGGRGAFSAVTAYRLSHYKPHEGSQPSAHEDEDISVRLVGAIGDDDIGKPMRDRITKAGVNTDRVRKIEDTKTSMIFVLEDEESQGSGAVMCPGANHALEPHDFDSVEGLLEECGGVKPNLLVTNCELKRDTVEQLVTTASEAGVPVLLNLVPEAYIFPEVLEHLTHLIVHEAEARRISNACPKDNDDPNAWETFAKDFRERGVANVVITLGSKGVYYSDSAGNKGHIPSGERNLDKVGGG